MLEAKNIVKKLSGVQLLIANKLPGKNDSNKIEIQAGTLPKAFFTAKYVTIMVIICIPA